MSDQALVQWSPESGAALPAYLSNAMDDLGSNIQDRMTVPSLSYEGKTWQIVKDGNKTKLQARNNDGDLVPIPVMRVVVLNYNPERGRAYYEGTYNPAAATAPKCWSANGEAPDDSVKEKQSSLCKTCPMSVKGSKVQDGKEMVACSSHRMIAVLPALDLEMDPLRLKIAVTSDYDKETVEHGWYAFRQYADYLKSRGISHTGLVVTKIKFDSNTAFPKLLFALDRILSESEVATVVRQLKNPKVAELLAERWTAAGSNGTPKDDSDIKPFGLEGAYADGWQAHPQSPGWSWKGTEVISNADLAARYPEPKAPPLPTDAAPPLPTEAAAPSVPASEMVIDVPATEVQSASTGPGAVATGPVWNPIEAAEKDGWVKHPDAPDYHYKGSDVVLSTEVAARYPAPAAIAEPAAPPAPPAPPAAPAFHDALALAAADGWAAHPDGGGWWFKGGEVVQQADVEARYPAPAGNAPAAGAAASSSAGSPQAASQSSAPAADAAVPADVQDLLNKWTG